MAQPGLNFTLLPGAATGRPATLGVMGGGQLARMWAHAATAMGYRTVVLEPDAQAPAVAICHQHIQAAYDDVAGLDALAQACDAVTTEFENVPSESLQRLSHSLPVSPAASSVAIAQDRLEEKTFFARACAGLGLGPVPHARVQNERDVEHASASLFPAILKTARMGYDGKGQVRVDSRAQLKQAWVSLGGVPCVLEKRLNLWKECSVVVARNVEGQSVTLPVQINTHVNGILARTEVSTDALAPELMQQADTAARAIAEHLSYVGVLCIEFFLTQSQDGTLSWVVNEMAPRPHNSGHYSIDACDISQFELQVRTMAGLPLVQPRLHSAAVMLNVLGDVWFDASDQIRTPAWDRVWALSGVHVHLYDKAQPRQARKMGHITITAPTLLQARAQAQAVEGILGLPPT